MVTAVRKAPPARDIVGEVAALVARLTGVQLGARQRPMVESRVMSRVSALGLADLAAYARHFDAARAAETEALIALLTTHHTYFFREPAHFDFLAERGLPGVARAAERRGARQLRIWCAACSRGQEAYSLAMLLATHMPRVAPGLGYEIVATDVDPASVRTARNGVYRFKDLASVPAAYLGERWARGTGEIEDFVKAKRELKERCRFQTVNLFELETWVEPGLFDVIFCRNVFIYFVPEQIQTIGQGLARRLVDGGLLFIGISETLNGLALPFAVAGPSIYRVFLSKVRG